MSQKVSPFMGGLGRDVTSKFEIQANATVTVGDGTNGGNVAVGDDGVISFGTGKDFQLWHDSGNNKSYIWEQGAGNLAIRGTNIEINNAADSKNMIVAADGGATTLYYNGSNKIATTNDGINVTGTVQGDGLVIDGTFDLGTL